MVQLRAEFKVNYDSRLVRDAAIEAAADLMEAITEQAQILAIDLAPVDKGELVASIHAEPLDSKRLRWGLFADAPHAIYVELGTIFMAAQAFLRPAVEAVSRFIPGFGARVASKFARGGYGSLVKIRRSRIR